ncbi:hypothetical protein L1049_002721 [Liquidambar formosana]|uniref:Uncharacterized protein n=1 Tax=Liquidambar formosana TaxID=63359 RepID=A0AAP0NGB2_LIQFO
MEVHSPVIAKRLWNILRITFLMMRKGVISKRKLIMDMNMMMKRGKLLRKTLGNLMSHHHSSTRHGAARGSYGIQEYEFSCSNSPNPVFFHVRMPKRKHHYFPCINPPLSLDDIEEERPKAVVLLPNTPDYTFNFRFDPSDELAPGEKRSPLLSPFSVRVSNYSSEDENVDGGNGQVDDEAEEFITRFYEQLRVQSRTQLLQYQEMQYQEMLARGTSY